MKRLSFVLLMFVSLWTVAAQDTTMSLTPNPLGRGDKFTMLIRIPDEDPGDLQLRFPEEISGYALYSGPYIGRYRDSETGDSGTQIRTIFRATGSGRLRFGGFQVVDDDGDLVFSPREELLEIGYYRNRKLIIPLEASWKIPEESLFVGQSVTASLMLENRPELSFVTRVSVPTAAGGFLEEVDGLGDIESSEIGGKTLYRIPGSSYIVTPSKPGSFEVPASRVYLGSQYGIAPKRTLQVKPLPEVVRSTGAVGNFRQRVWYQPDQPVQGEPLTFTVRIEGEGNLHYLQIPGLTYEGSGETREISRLRPALQGYQGYKEVEFSWIPESAGRTDVFVPPFPFWNTETESIDELPARQFRLNVLPSVEEQTVQDLPLWEEFPLLSWELLAEAGSGFFYLNPMNYILLLGGGLAGLVFFLLGRRKTGLAVLMVLVIGGLGAQSVSRELETIKAASEAQNWTEALRLVRVGEELWDSSDVYHYNRGLLAAYEAIPGEAVFHLRRAIDMNPGEKVYHETLDSLSREWGLLYQVSKVPSIDPDLFFWILILSFTGFGLFLGLFFFKRRRIFLGWGVLFFLTAAGAVGMLGWLDYSRNLPWAVISAPEDLGILKKIPRREARPWIELNNGASVWVLGESEEFFFVESGNGLRGWILKEQILREGEG